MKDSAKRELLRLIELEIDLGFTFLDTSSLSSDMGHTEHATQALRDAQDACERASGILDQLTEEEASRFLPDLGDLQSEIRARTDHIISKRSN